MGLVTVGVYPDLCELSQPGGAGTKLSPPPVSKASTLQCVCIVGVLSAAGPAIAHNTAPCCR